MAYLETMKPVKQARMHLRVDALSKQKLQRAASYLGTSLSDFVISQALSAADEVIRQHETLTLDEAGWEVFLDALENPPQPNSRLRKAFSEHEKHVQRC